MRRALAMLCLVGCGGIETPPATGGTDVPVSACGRGLVVVASDYQSTNVALVGSDGAVLSSSFISSASADVGLSAPLSGDVVPPSAVQLGADVVLIDRFPAAVLTWVDVASGAVRAQLDVGTGFAANPQDYAEHDGRGYLTRYETNTAPGAEPHDGGGDVLVIDPDAPAIVDRIDLSAAMADAPGFLPRPGPIVAHAGSLVTLLAAYDASFTDTAPSRLARIDPATGEVTATHVLAGLHGCSAMAVEAPLTDTGDLRADPRIAVACTGKFGGDSVPTLAEGGIAVLSADFEELALVPATSLGEPPGFGIAFDGDRLLVTTLGRYDGSEVVLDQLLAVAADSSSVSALLTSETLPFELGQVRCLGGVTQAAAEPGCGSCFLADADRGLIHRIDGAGVTAFGLDDGIGLPPRYLGRF